jgi:hypothetical protein
MVPNRYWAIKHAYVCTVPGVGTYLSSFERQKSLFCLNLRNWKREEISIQIKNIRTVP